MRTPEMKLADLIADATDDHYFNPSIVAHALAEQPYYTTDRIVELITEIIRYQSQRHENDWADGKSSEGLFLANELYKSLGRIKEAYRFQNLSLPK
jgi:hypothetical protein